MGIFVDYSAQDVIAAGVRYLRIEGSFYCGIGCLLNKNVLTYPDTPVILILI